MTEQELKAAADKARDEFNAIKSERDAAFREAKREVENRIVAEYAERYKAARDAKYAAENTLREHINATASHEWEGRKVVRTSERYKSVWATRTTTVVEYGVVEVARSNTQFPANLRAWGLPKLGKPFVRLLKKDGKLGLKFESFTDDWQLAEDVEA